MRAIPALAVATAMLGTCLLLPGCGADPEPAKPTVNAADPNDKAPDKPDDLRQFMEEDQAKARDANQQQLDRAEADRKAVEEAGG